MAVTVRLWVFAVLALILGGTASAQQRGPLVLAAASLQEAMTDAANDWAARKHARPILSFAGSPALARQIVAGAPADIFVSADEEWMTVVAAKGMIRPRTRATFLSNRLVLIVPLNSKLRLSIAHGFPLSRAIGAGRLAMADPDTVPAGRYGKAALQSLGVWPTVQGKLARAENVRAALALVERGEAPLGIVYATDAKASSRVRIVGVFPPTSHPAITYPIAMLTKSSNRDAAAFQQFLLSPAGKAIFARRGFVAH